MNSYFSIFNLLKKAMTNEIICLTKGCQQERIFRAGQLDYHDEHKIKKYVLYKSNAQPNIKELLDYNNLLN